MVNIPRAAGAAFIEAQMKDTCTIDRDVRGVFDDILNEATGELESSGTEDTEVYSGICLVATVNQGDKFLRSADMPNLYNVYKVLLPQEEANGNIRIGDILTIVTSTQSPALVAKTFRVYKVETATHPVYTRLMVEDTESDIGTSLQ